MVTALLREVEQPPVAAGAPDRGPHPVVALELLAPVEHAAGVRRVGALLVELLLAQLGAVGGVDLLLLAVERLDHLALAPGDVDLEHLALAKAGEQLELEAHLALDLSLRLRLRLPGLPAPPLAVAVEQGHRRLPTHDRVGDRVGVALVGVALAADPALELDPGALLDDVRRLVGRRVQGRRGRGEGDAALGRVGLRADAPARSLGRRARVGPDPADLVGPEGPLDRLQVRQRAAGAADARARALLDLRVADRACGQALQPDAPLDLGAALDHRRQRRAAAISRTVRGDGLERADRHAVGPRAQQRLALALELLARLSTRARARSVPTRSRRLPSIYRRRRHDFQPAAPRPRGSAPRKSYHSNHDTLLADSADLCPAKDAPTRRAAGARRPRAGTRAGGSWRRPTPPSAPVAPTSRRVRTPYPPRGGTQRGLRVRLDRVPTAPPIAKFARPPKRTLGETSSPGAVGARPRPLPGPNAQPVTG